MPRPFPPPDLTYLILDNLYGDKSSLKLCSLVCRAWTHPAQSRLFASLRCGHEVFHEIGLRSSTDGKVMGSRLASYVRKFDIGPSDRVGDVLEVLSEMKFVESLCVQGISIGKEALDSAPAMDFHRVRTLDIFACVFATDECFVRFLGYFPHLETLNQKDTVIDKDSAGHSSGSMPHLRSITSTGISRFSIEVLERVLTPEAALQICSARFYDVKTGSTQMSAMSHLLGKIGSTLEHLTIEIPGNLTDRHLPGLSVSSNTALRTLDLAGDSCAWMVGVLSQVTSLSLEKITFWLSIPRGGRWVMLFEEIGRILSGPQFNTIQQIVFRVHRQTDSRELVCYAIQKGMGNLNDRNILTIDSFDALTASPKF